MEVIHAALLLLLAVACVAYEEYDIFCQHNNAFIRSEKVCDGVVDCVGSPGGKDSDENNLVCAPAPYLQHPTSLEASDVTGTSVHLSWQEPPRHIPGHSLYLAGYLLFRKFRDQTWRSGESLPERWLSHTVKGLKPLTSYTFIVRPYYTKSGKSDDPQEHRFIGKAAAVDVRTLSKGEEISSAVLEGFFDLSVTPISSSEVLISWNPLESAPVYQVTMHKDEGQGNLAFHEVRTFNASEKALSTHSVLFDNLEPWTHYVAQLEACSEDKCTGAGKRRFLTPPEELPHPVVTEIESTHAGSISLKWSFPGVDHELYNGFRVRFCERNASSCLLAFTKETEYDAEGLANDTRYDVDVRAHLKLADGILKLGPPGTATVTTWTDVPVLDVSHKHDFYDQSGTSLLAWTAVNSSVTSIQYRLAANDDWTSCKESAECNFIASHKSTERYATGYMSITHGKKDRKVTIGVRGCNDHGCGKEYTVVFNWRGLEYPTAYHFRVFYIDGNAVLRWNQYANDGFEVASQCGNDSKVRYENRMYPYTRERNYETITVQGVPYKAQGCEFTLETFRETKGLTYYSIPREAYRDF